MKDPLFSVIVPAYNAASFLDICVTSVLEQTCGDFELLLIDDGSRDATLSLCRQFAQNDSRVRVFHQENQGHTGARNTGLTNSRGEYVLFLDCDDRLDRDVLARCAGQIGTHRPDILVFDLYAHRGSEVTKLPCALPEGVYDAASLKNALLLTADGTFALPKSLSGKVFARQAVTQYQLAVPREVLIGEDGACFVCAALHCRSLCVLEGTGYHFDTRPDSVSHTGDSRALSRLPYLLNYYRKQLALSDPEILAQYERTVVAQLYTAVRFEIMAGCGRRQIKQDLQAALGDADTRSSLKNARFSRKGRKLKIKQQLLRFQLLWLIKLL